VVFAADVQARQQGHGERAEEGVPDEQGQGDPDVAVDEALAGGAGGRVVVDAGPVDAGAEAILQIRAAYLSHDGRLGRYFATRPGCHYRRRP
jgi:hypothetical protein